MIIKKQEDFMTADLIKKVIQPQLQSSKKSVDFKDEIPIKTDKIVNK